ncbi:MAG: fibronectin type III domain-containing protein [Chloroflexi bacterium]|jgi:hypothetical protein|nr:fibronectin type III domain-containing protein [Chloroflexota bacterium]
MVSNPGEITVEAEQDQFLIRVPGLENGTEYTFTVTGFKKNGRSGGFRAIKRRNAFGR